MYTHPYLVTFRLRRWPCPPRTRHCPMTTSQCWVVSSRSPTSSASIRTRAMHSLVRAWQSPLGTQHHAAPPAGQGPRSTGPLNSSTVPARQDRRRQPGPRHTARRIALATAPTRAENRRASPFPGLTLPAASHHRQETAREDHRGTRRFRRRRHLRLTRAPRPAARPRPRRTPPRREQRPTTRQRLRLRGLHRHLGRRNRDQERSCTGQRAAAVRHRLQDPR